MKMILKKKEQHEITDEKYDILYDNLIPFNPLI